MSDWEMQSDLTPWCPWEDWAGRTYTTWGFGWDCATMVYLFCGEEEDEPDA